MIISEEVNESVPLIFEENGPFFRGCSFVDTFIFLFVKDVNSPNEWGDGGIDNGIVQAITRDSDLLGIKLITAFEQCLSFDKISATSCLSLIRR